MIEFFALHILFYREAMTPFGRAGLPRETRSVFLWGRSAKMSVWVCG
jgi:hypothetical protein